jgi:hypothetical protein
VAENNPYYGRDRNGVLQDPSVAVSETNVAYGVTMSRITWAAVFAGVILALGVQFLLNTLGAGIGASTIDPGETPDAQSLGIAAGVWWMISTFIALFIGGWIAGRLAGIPRPADGMIHGLLTWGLSTLLLLYFLGTAVGAVLGGAVNLIGGGVAAVAPHAAGAAKELLSEADISWTDIRKEARELLRQTGKPELRPEALEREGKQAAEGAAQNPPMSDEGFEGVLERLVGRGEAVTSEVDREAAINVLVARTDMSPAEAAKTVDNWTETYKRATTQAAQQTRQVADATAEAVAKGSVWAFLALLLGAAAAGCGGAIGAPRRAVVTPK